MSGLWQRLIARVNAMTLRERFLLFASVMVVFAALTESLFIAPLNKLQKQRAQQIDQNSEASEAQRTRLEFELQQRRRVRAEELAAEIARVQREIDAVDRDIAALAAGAGDVVALRAVLTRVPRRSDKVALLRVTTTDPVSAPPAGTAASRSGLDITLGGGYLDLMDYLATLEAALPQARWSALRFTAETVPAQASVRIVAPRPAP